MSLLQVLVNLHLAPFPKPASSIVDDFPTEQNHKGWQVMPHRLAPDWPGPGPAKGLPAHCWSD